MKQFHIPFAAAVAISLLALATAYIEGESHPTTPANYLWFDQLQQLNELCRVKYRQSRRYEDYAHYAEQNNSRNVAILLRAISRADAVQCENCRKAIESLGGKFYYPVTRTAEPASTIEQMDSILSDKRICRTTYTEVCLDQAIADGNRYIARMLTWCDASDMTQIIMLMREIGESTDTDSSTAPRLSFVQADDAGLIKRSYEVCPTCGNITEQGVHTRYCPHCMTDSKEFFFFN